jgi:carboxyl-terminal processing protease
MLQFMKNKILIPLLILGALAAFFSFRHLGDEGTTDEKKEKVLNTVMRALNDGHYAPRAIDDSFSNNVYNKLLSTFDFDKKFFTKEDLTRLEPYRYQIDDQVTAGSLEFYKAFDGLFVKNLARAEGYYKEILDKPFSFNSNETIELDGEKLAYTANDKELKQRWYEYLKYRTLAKYVDLKKEQEKKKENKDSLNAVMKTDAELEAQARESIRKNQETFFKRWKKVDDNQRFALFINSIAGTEDPHTDYLPPKDKQRFDVGMSGTFSGIGASLSPADGKITVASVIPGSPAWKQGELKNGDEIIKVAQGEAEPVDIQGYDLEDAIDLIRGKKGTEVRLTVKRVNGAIKVIPIVRGDVFIEETFAKSAIIETPGGRIGYIHLPEFYADFNKADGRRCAEDVGIEVMKLKNEGVTGIILDLRYNGGGSLSDVVDMTGHFIDKGPVVQVKSANGAPLTMSDTRPGTLYDGPLAIMVNQGSASASEIMAAALQDYKRAVIVGMPTFGKGTVQRVMSLDELASWMGKMGLAVNGDMHETSGIGALKITVQKFYRVNGGSTQLKGVTPDIILPDPYAQIEMGEGRDKAALKWDEIPAANYTPESHPVNVAALASASKKRTDANPTFNLIKESASRIKRQEEDNTYPLNEAAYRKKLDEANETSKKMEELEKKLTQLTIGNPKADMAKINIDTTSINKNKEWIKNLQKDVYLSETVNIVNDLAKQQMKVNLGTGMK